CARWHSSNFDFW
nr:immunoglobulin heavy chain junction region [Macaca mulatta]